jgi:hypothetical protein
MPFLVALSRGGCRPHKPKPDCPYHTITPFLEKFGGSISQLIFHVSGSHYILDHRGNEDSAAAFLAGNEVKFDRANVMKAAAYLEGLPTGPELVWLGPFAEARVDLTSPENFSPERLRFNSVSLSHFSALDTELKAWSSQHRGFRYISLIDALAFNTDTLVSGDCLTFADEDHFSRCGEELFGPYIADALK